MTPARFVRNPLLAWREIEGEVVVISPQDSMVHELNSTASFIWCLVDGRRTAAEIAGSLAQKYDVAPDAALLDTQELLSRLASRGLLISALSGQEERDV